MKTAVGFWRMLAGLVLMIPLLAIGDDRAELAGLLETFLAGASVNDSAVHDRFWAEDLIYTSSDGRRFGKAEIMASLAETARTEPRETPEYSARDVTIRVFADTAIVTFRLEARHNGEPVGQYLNSGVFRKGANGWQAVNWQATRAAEDGGTAASGD